ncbi:hypothetical protein MAPG_10983, partial [Magnaporthiopsis poae ATCC 64411]
MNRNPNPFLLRGLRPEYVRWRPVSGNGHFTGETGTPDRVVPTPNLGIPTAVVVHAVASRPKPCSTRLRWLKSHPLYDAWDSGSVTRSRCLSVEVPAALFRGWPLCVLAFATDFFASLSSPLAACIFTGWPSNEIVPTDFSIAPCFCLWVSLLTEDQLAHLTLPAADDPTTQGGQSKLDVVIDLVAHRKANLKVLEVDFVGGEGASSAWFQAAAGSSVSVRAAYSRYDFASTDAKSLVGIQAWYGSHGGTSRFLAAAAAAASGAFGLTVDVRYDLVLVKSPYGPASRGAAPLAPEDVVRKLKPLMAPGAFVVLVACNDETPTSIREGLNKKIQDAAGGNHEHDDILTPLSSSLSDSGSSHITSRGNFSPGNSPEDSTSEAGTAPSDTNDGSSTAWNRQTLRRFGKAGGHFDAILGMHVAAAERQTIFVGRIKANNNNSGQEQQQQQPAATEITPGGLGNLAVLRFQNSTPKSTQPLRDMLETSGWKVTHHHQRDVAQLLLFQQTNSSSTVVLVLNELVSPFLATVNGQQWESTKALTGSGTPVLWVTKGTQFDRVTDPDRELVYGLFRTVRREDSSARLTVLDVKSGAAS